MKNFDWIYSDDSLFISKAKRETHGTEIDGQKIRVDFSLTEKPHERTPGIYMGMP